MTKNVLLDSWAVLALVNAEEPAATRVKSLLTDASQKQIRVFLSLINLGEIYYTIGRRSGQAVAQQILARACDG